MNRQQAVIRLPTVLIVGGILLLAVGLFVVGGTINEGAPLLLARLGVGGATKAPTPPALMRAADDGTRFTFDVATRQWVDSPTPAIAPNDKYAAIRARATQEAVPVPSATRFWPLPTVTPDLTPAAWPPDALPYRAAGAGYIITGAPLGLSSSTFTDTNLWAERLPDRFITVHAGGDGYAGDPTQGLLVISVGTLPPHRTQIGPIETYHTPSKAGPVTITDAVGERLTLQAADGIRFTFDVASRQWGNP